MRQAGGGKQKSSSGSRGGASEGKASASKKAEKKEATGSGGSGGASSGGAGGDDFDKKLFYQFLFRDQAPPPLGYQVMMLILKLMNAIGESDEAERQRLLTKFYELECVRRAFSSSVDGAIEITLEQLEEIVKSLSGSEQQLILDTFSDEERVLNFPLKNAEQLKYFAPGLKARFM